MLVIWRNGNRKMGKRKERDRGSKGKGDEMGKVSVGCPLVIISKRKVVKKSECEREL